jgi:dTDP-4-amino-4,6-dideoxygalactose transaminase
VRLPFVPPECEQSYHIYWLLLPDLQTRTRFIETLKREGILCVSHYQPLHASRMGRRLAAPGSAPCTVSEDVAQRLVRLPFYNDLSDTDRDRVIERVLAFFAA